VSLEPLRAGASTGTGTAGPAGEPGAGARHHLLSVVVENKSGVLARVASLFSRRGYNIFSLAVAPTDDERLSRITIVVDVESAPLEQIVHQLDKLVNVVSISELAPEQAIERELLLATVRADASQRVEVAALVGMFQGTVIDVAADRVTVAVTGTPDALDDAEGLLAPFGIVELQRTGRVALPKLGRRRRLQPVADTAV
jgi:acetolactate synthase-1/3 small subunit